VTPNAHNAMNATIKAQILNTGPMNFDQVGTNQNELQLLAGSQITPPNPDCALVQSASDPEVPPAHKTTEINAKNAKTNTEPIDDIYTQQKSTRQIRRIRWDRLGFEAIAFLSNMVVFWGLKPIEKNAIDVSFGFLPSKLQQN
jgi:hypothetical protein